MKKISKYTHLLRTDEGDFIYNLINGNAIALHPQIFELIKNSMNVIDNISARHPDLYDGLEQSGMIVSEDIDETSELINSFEKEDCDPAYFSIILNPTLDCNLRCWYCYENHGKGTIMNEQTIDSIKRLIDNKISEPVLKHLNLSFFGGEPIIGWHKVVMPILSYASACCNKKGIRLSAEFTTNGVLLSEEKYEQLQSYGIYDVTFQITLDGYKIFHDRSRVGADKKPTYDRIMKNVALGASKEYKIILRFNYTPETVESFSDVLSELDELPEETKRYINCNFQQVWQTTGSNVSTHNRALELNETFNGKKLSSNCDGAFYRQSCYADKENSILVNYNGDLFKCTAREFSKEKREGILQTDGSLKWNERYAHRMSVKYSNNTCKNCEVFPICNGHCSQTKIESGIIDGCYVNKSVADRKGMLIGSFYQRIFNKHLSDSEIKNVMTNAMII